MSAWRTRGDGMAGIYLLLMLVLFLGLAITWKLVEALSCRFG